MKTTLEIYTDGSATTSDKPGGWAFRVVGNGVPVYENSGFMEKASNNDAELEAALQGLEYMRSKYETAQRNPKSDDIYLVSDSEIILGWATGRFRTRQKEKSERVERLQLLVSTMGVQTRWVKGHSTNEHNIRCDKMAKKARSGHTTETKNISSKTLIGMKKSGVIVVWFKDVLKVVDLGANIIEDYNHDLHGYRSSKLEIRVDRK